LLEVETSFSIEVEDEEYTVFNDTYTVQPGTTVVQKDVNLNPTLYGGLSILFLMHL
jgi:hypothetical protein